MAKMKTTKKSLKKISNKSSKKPVRSTRKKSKKISNKTPSQLKDSRKKTISKVNLNKKRVIEIVGRVSSDSILKSSGKDWDEWVKILNAAGAVHWTFKEVSDYLKKKQKGDPWWVMMVAYGYEVYTGRRIDGQNQKGLYSVTVTRSLSHPHMKAWNLLISPEGLQAWLKPMSELLVLPKNSFEVEGGIFGEIRTMKSPERIRFTWQDTDWDKPTVVQAMIYPRPKGKSLIIIMHDSIKTNQIKENLRQHWRNAITEFETLLDSL